MKTCNERYQELHENVLKTDKKFMEADKKFTAVDGVKDKYDIENYIKKRNEHLESVKDYWGFLSWMKNNNKKPNDPYIEEDF